MPSKNKQKSILVLDDDKNLLDALATMLERCDFDVSCANNAKCGIEMVKKKTYDFVLVDYRMPENDGIWFMKNAKLGKKTKAVLMTAYANRDVINRMFDLGACGYVIKPFDQDDIIRHLDFYAK